MPIVLRVGPFVLRFYAREGTEPPHIHVQRDAAEAKFWLAPVKLAGVRGMAPQDVRRAERIVREHEQLLLHAWADFFEGHDPRN